MYVCVCVCGGIFQNCFFFILAINDFQRGMCHPSAHMTTLSPPPLSVCVCFCLFFHNPYRNCCYVVILNLYYQITGIANQGKTVSVLVRGSNKLVLEEAERSIHDALCVIRCLVKKRYVVRT